jgi:hypothetical protein
MESVRETKSLRWWIGIAIYAISMLAMAVSLVWVVGLAGLAALAPHHDGIGILTAPSLLTLYVSVLAFPVAMLVQPHRGRALWFAAFGTLYILVFLADFWIGFNMPFWPRFMRAGP